MPDCIHLTFIWWKPTDHRHIQEYRVFQICWFHKSKDFIAPFIIERERHFIPGYQRIEPFDENFSQFILFGANMDFPDSLPKIHSQTDIS